MVDEPKAADAATDDQAAASQQTTATAPDGAGNPEVMTREGAREIIASRDEAKAKAAALAAETEAQAKLIAELKANQTKVSQADIERLEKIKAEEAAAAKTEAMESGDADAIAEAARKPLQEENDALRQAKHGYQDQLATLLRDKALKTAVESSQLGAVAPQVIVDALKHRVSMKEAGGQYVPEFLGDNGQPLFNAQGKVVDVQVFVDEYLGRNLALCKAKTQPGSGAPAPGQGSTETVTQGRKPQSVAEWVSWNDDQKAAANMQPGELDALTFPKDSNAGPFGS